ncbi:MAG: CAP domain-containing protein [Anaerolineales bacterium]|nr:CAP domain-containing protein [Anaerolineales bacterium]
MSRFKLRFAGIGLIGLLALASIRLTASAQPAALRQSPELALQEAQTVYLGNLARHSNGLPPLRWNRQLTDAARWFSWDSVENRPTPYCGHQDTQGHWPDYRARAFGYLGLAGAENAFCGYVTPQQAVEGWMNSPGHRANLLDPNSREVGLGYYRRGDGRGYVTQKFGVDAAFAPVIIQHEAITTTTPSVNLYIYDRSPGGGFAGMAPATHMLVSNDRCFLNANWEAFTPNRAWSLPPGEGWRSVYVKTRDVFSRTLTVSDTIYLGAGVPIAEIGEGQMSTTRPQVTLYRLDGGGLPQAQFSLGWLADDSFSTYQGLWGEVTRVADPAAWGGTASRLGSNPQGGETSSWVWDTTFIKGVPMVAYVRLKVASNTSAAEVARFTATGGGTLRLKGTDFDAPDRYQEFPLPFTFPPGETFLIFQFWRSGSTDVYVDAVSIFTAPQPFTSPMVWSVPGGNYRGQGVWVRYTNGAQFSPFTEAATDPPLSVTPGAITLLAAQNGSPPPPAILIVGQACPSVGWQVSDDADWLTTQVQDHLIRLTVNRSDLSLGSYTARVTVTPVNAPGVSPVSAMVTLLVVDRVYSGYLPLVQR